MKKFCIMIFFILLIVYSCSTKSSTLSRTTSQQKFLTMEEIKRGISEELSLDSSKIIDRYIWIQYADIDEDPELEMIISYRYELHKGYFFIFDYKNGKYVMAFTRNWPVEKMSMKEVVYASGNDTTHALTASILQMQEGKVNIIWSGIYDKYDYSKLIKGIEVHGRYYIDTNDILNYFYKVDKTDKSGVPIKTEFRNEKYIWDSNKNMFIKSKE